MSQGRIRRDGAMVVYRPFGSPPYLSKLMKSILRMRGYSYLTGRGERTISTLERRPSRYTEEDLRQIRARNGVGRPPHVNLERMGINHERQTRK